MLVLRLWHVKCVVRTCAAELYGRQRTLAGPERRLPLPTLRVCANNQTEKEKKREPVGGSGPQEKSLGGGRQEGGGRKGALAPLVLRSLSSHAGIYYLLYNVLHRKIFKVQ